VETSDLHAVRRVLSSVSRLLSEYRRRPNALPRRDVESRWPRLANLLGQLQEEMKELAVGGRTVVEPRRCEELVLHAPDCELPDFALKAYLERRWGAWLVLSEQVKSKVCCVNWRGVAGAVERKRCTFVGAVDVESSPDGERLYWRCPRCQHEHVEGEL
jgi:hypothetical protein